MGRLATAAPLSVADTVSGLEPDRLREVSEAGDTMMRMVASRNKRAAWQLLADQFRAALGASSSTFYLIPVDGTGRSGKLEAESPPAGPPGQDRTAAPADFDGVGSQLLTEITDRKGHLLGFVVSTPGASPFTAGDQAVAEALARKTAIPLDLLRTLKLLRDLRKEVHRAQSHDDIFRATLRAATQLLRSAVGRTVIRDRVSGQWVFGPQLPEAPALAGQPLPPDDPLGHVLCGAGSAADAARTLAVPISWGVGRCALGALEVAATHRPFDAQDADLLQWVARHAASDCELVEKTLAWDDWDRPPPDGKRGPADVAQRILQSVCDPAGFGLDGGIVYKAVPRAQYLLGFKVFGGGRETDEARPYVYHIKRDRSAAVLVYGQDHGRFWKEPWASPEVNQQGLIDFDIRGPLFAVPLNYRNQHVGVLVAWWRDPDAARQDLAAILRDLEAFGRRAARSLWLALYTQTTEHRSRLQSSIARILQQMLTVADRDRNLQAIMDGIREFSFDRVRVYEFRYGNTFVGLTSSGMEDPDAFRALENAIESNPYARHLYLGVIEARRLGPEGLLARVYPLQQDELDGKPVEGRRSVQQPFVRDPVNGPLGKPDDLPWAEVPLLSAGRLYGAIAADNTNSRRVITDDDLDGLDLFAQLAARAFAQAETSGALVPRHLAVLESTISPHERAEVVRQRLLRFATHGEGGLGFSRAALWEPDESGARLRFTEGVGSVTKARFLSVARGTCRKPLKEVLDEAATPRQDRQLYDALQACAIRPEDVRAVLDREGATWPQAAGAAAADWVQPLRRVFDDDLLAAPVRAGQRTPGLLVVDRRWQDSGLDETDAEALWSFAQFAGHVLFQRASVEKRYNDLELQLRGLAHEVSRPLIALQAACQPADSDPPNMKVVREQLTRLIKTVASIQACVDEQPARSFVSIGLRELLSGLPDLVATLRPAGVSLQVGQMPDESAQLFANASQLRLALDNLVRNAADALGPTAQANKTVTVDIRQHDTVVRVEVRDSGPGVAPDVLPRVLDEASLYTSKPSRGSGFGLRFVRRTLRQHGGQLELQNLNGQGFSATMVLPLFRPGGS